MLSREKLRNFIQHGDFSFQTLQDLRWELLLTRLRWNNRLNPWRRQQAKRLSKRSDVRLHWGCGRRHLDGWVNVDCVPGPNVDYVMDLRGRLPFRDGTVQYIFTEHVFEHLSPEHGMNVLRDFHRVLQPNGRLRIVVPHLRRICESYLANDDQFFQSTGLGNDSVNGLNGVFYNHFHRWMYDYNSLAQCLRDAGFEHVEESSHMGSSEPLLHVETDRPSRALVSLYVEAQPVATKKGDTLVASE